MEWLLQGTLTLTGEREGILTRDLRYSSLLASWKYFLSLVSETETHITHAPDEHIDQYYYFRARKTGILLCLYYSLKQSEMVHGRLVPVSKYIGPNLSPKNCLIIYIIQNNFSPTRSVQILQHSDQEKHTENLTTL